MRFFKLVVLFFSLWYSLVDATDFTIANYNCGGLSQHYDYLRAACMQKIAQERYHLEPAAMSRFEKAQQIALQALFSQDPAIAKRAQRQWKWEEYDAFFHEIIQPYTVAQSPSASWYQKVLQTMTSYKERPVVIYDNEITDLLRSYLKNFVKEEGVEDLQHLLTLGRHAMAKKIFHYYLKYDIICLQEADYLDSTVFPEGYQGAFLESIHSINGIVWNSHRFEQVGEPIDIEGRACVVTLIDKQTGYTVLVASGHLTGCNPFEAMVDPTTGELDSVKGDRELQKMIHLLENTSADIKLISMDSNVTAMHPRLKLVKDAGYLLDAENFIEPTCTHPYYVLNTRIDWIAVKSSDAIKPEIMNLPVLSVGLNSIETNISDHKPVAAVVYYP